MVWYVRTKAADKKGSSCFAGRQYVCCKYQQLWGLELDGRENWKSDSEREGKKSRGEAKGNYVERSNERGRSTSTVVARMRDHGTYAGWPNGRRRA